MNDRITAAIARTNTRIAERGLSDTRIAELSQNLNMDLDEYFRFQELKTLAVNDGKLSNTEGMLVYEYLGNTLDHFNNQPLAVKTVLTQLFQELLGLRIGQMKAGAK